LSDNLRSTTILALRCRQGAILRPSVGGLFDALSSGWGASPKGQDLGFFIAAVRALERVNGRVAFGGVKTDDGASYRAAACWADAIDNEVQRHGSFLSLQANGGPSRESAKIVLLRGRSGALRWRLSRTQNCNFAMRICRDRWVKLSTGNPQPPIRRSGSV
jgi:hypothetical protein